jgi:hypothetical protein
MVSSRLVSYFVVIGGMIVWVLVLCTCMFMFAWPRLRRSSPAWRVVEGVPCLQRWPNRRPLTWPPLCMLRAAWRRVPRDGVHHITQLENCCDAGDLVFLGWVEFGVW